MSKVRISSRLPCRTCSEIPPWISHPYHCSLRACKKHSITSMHIRTNIVTCTNTAQPMKIEIKLQLSIPPPIVFEKNTFASYPWASDNAQRRRYDAVFEILPSTNSIVSMIWWTKISPNSNSSPCPWPWPPYFAYF